MPSILLSITGETFNRVSSAIIAVCTKLKITKFKHSSQVRKRKKKKEGKYIYLLDKTLLFPVLSLGPGVVWLAWRRELVGSV